MLRVSPSLSTLRVLLKSTILWPENGPNRFETSPSAEAEEIGFESDNAEAHRAP